MKIATEEMRTLTAFWEPILEAMRKAINEARYQMRKPMLFRVKGLPSYDGLVCFGIAVDPTSGDDHLQCLDGTRIKLKT